MKGNAVKRLSHELLLTEANKGVVSAGSSVLIACSGGPDSMALLYWLSRWRVAVTGQQLRLGVAVVNHRLRSAGDEEVKLVQQEAVKLGIPCYVRSVDVAAEAARRGVSIETAGRDVRYTFFKELMISENYDYVATAHHSDDRAETILAHLLRGSGLAGLVGMQVLQGRLWRPFLRVPKAMLVAALDEEEIAYAIDATNNEPIYLRNRIRLDLLPMLESYNPQVRSALLRLGDAASGDEAYLMAEAMKALKNATIKKVVSDGSKKNGEKQGNGNDTEAIGWLLRRKVVDKLPDPLFYRLWRHISETMGDMDTFSAVYVTQLRQVVSGDGVKEFVVRRMKVRAQYDIIQIGCFFEAQRKPSAPLMFTVTKHDWDGEGSLPNAGQLWLPQSYDGQALCIRSRQAGDRIVLIKRDGTVWGRKKVKDWLIDKKVPPMERDAMKFWAIGSLLLGPVSMKTPIIIREPGNTHYWCATLKEDI